MQVGQGLGAQGGLAHQVVKVAQRALAPGGDDALGQGGAQSRHPQQGREGRAVDVHGEALGVLGGPQGLGVLLQIEKPPVVRGDFVVGEAVGAHEEVGLVEAVLAGEQCVGVAGRPLFTGELRRSQTALIGVVIHPVQPQARVESPHPL